MYRITILATSREVPLGLPIPSAEAALAAAAAINELVRCGGSDALVLVRPADSGNLPQPVPLHQVGAAPAGDPRLN
jgi:hypothetical protein